MDPIAHTLAGACMAQTRLKRLTPLALPTLIIAANLPDIDVVFQFISRDASLYYRRGMTHGVIAMIVLPLLLAFAVEFFDRTIRQKHNPAASPVDRRALILISYLGVLSHPLLDLLNTYGVRLLMPLSGRWFYGDLLFIVDAWLWLLMAASVVCAYSKTWMGKIGWIVLAALTSYLVTTNAMVPFAAKLVWGGGLLGIVVIRWRSPTSEKNEFIAMACTALFLAYLAALTAGNFKARDMVVLAVESRSGEKVMSLMSGPLPANPFQRVVVAKTATQYHGYRARLLGSPSLESMWDPVPVPRPDPITNAALAKKEIRGFVNWMRYPAFSVADKEGGYQVTIRDLRYVAPDAAPGFGIGTAEVFVQQDEVEELAK